MRSAGVRFNNNKPNWFSLFIFSIKNAELHSLCKRLPTKLHFQTTGSTCYKSISDWCPWYLLFIVISHFECLKRKENRWVFSLAEVVSMQFHFNRLHALKIASTMEFKCLWSGKYSIKTVAASIASKTRNLPSRYAGNSMTVCNKQTWWNDTSFWWYH